MTVKATLRLPSPNNTKVQVALAYKAIDYEIDAVSGGEPETIAKLVALSGQPLTPILEHGDVVMFDSGAILRYLDANFPGPRLFSADREEFKAIEGWESFHKNEIMDALRPAFEVFFGGMKGPEADANIDRANAAFYEVTAKVEQALAEQKEAGSEWLVGSTMTAADIFVACFAAFCDLPEGQEDWNPLWKWFNSRIVLGEDRELTRGLIHRVMKLLPAPVAV
jgi:glutathione S-transferase